MSNLITIDGKKVVYGTTLLVADEHEVDLRFDVEGWQCRVIFTFHPNAPEPEPPVQATPEGDHLRIRFNRWTNAIGTALPAPVPIAASPSGSKIYMALFHHKVGSLNRLDIQFALEEKSV